MSTLSLALVRAGAKFLAPLAVLFAVYLAAAGLDGLGGGFAGGLAFALGVSLYALAFGVDAARAVCPSWAMRGLVSMGGLGFVALGAAGAVRGYNFFDYQALLNALGPQTQRFGVSIAEFCMLAATGGGFVLMVFAILGRAGDMKDAEW